MRVTVMLVVAVTSVLAVGSDAAAVSKNVEGAQASVKATLGVSSDRRFLRVNKEDETEEERGWLIKLFQKSSASLKKSESAKLLANGQSQKTLTRAQSSNVLAASKRNTALATSKSMSAKQADMEKRAQIAIATALKAKAKLEGGVKVKPKPVTEEKVVTPKTFFRDNNLANVDRSDPKWAEYSALKEKFREAGKYGTRKKTQLLAELKKKWTQELSS